MAERLKGWYCFATWRRVVSNWQDTGLENRRPQGLAGSSPAPSAMRRNREVLRPKHTPIFDLFSISLIQSTCMAIDWTNIFKQYKGLWVALKEDEETVVGSGQTAKEALEAAQKHGYDRPILTHMPEKLATYVGFGL